MIGGMMGHLGETAGLLADDQTRETAIPSGPMGVNLRIPLAAAVPFLEADRCVDNGFRSPMVTGESD